MVNGERVAVKVRFAVLGLVAVGALLLAACGGSGEPYVEVVGVRWATASGASVPALVSSSDAVFTARVTAELPQREETLPGPPDRPTEARTFPVSRFEAAVESASAGTVPGGTVVIEQAGGEDPGDGHTVVLEGDEPMVVGQTYMFFATQKENGSWATTPFGRFAVREDGALEVAEEWRALPASQALAGQQLAVAEGRVRSAAGE
jgi:hypothetical protein